MLLNLCVERVILAWILHEVGGGGNTNIHLSHTFLLIYNLSLRDPDLNRRNRVAGFWHAEFFHHWNNLQRLGNLVHDDFQSIITLEGFLLLVVRMNSSLNRALGP